MNLNAQLIPTRNSSEHAMLQTRNAFQQATPAVYSSMYTIHSIVFVFQHGYIRMKRGVNQCGLINQASYPTGVKAINPAPPTHYGNPARTGD
jgi:hypothetical protein